MKDGNYLELTVARPGSLYQNFVDSWELDQVVDFRLEIYKKGKLSFLFAEQTL